MNSSGIRIREAISEDMFAIMELKKAMADYHRALDAFYLPGEELRPGLKIFYETGWIMKMPRLLYWKRLMGLAVILSA